MSMKTHYCEINQLRKLKNKGDKSKSITNNTYVCCNIDEKKSRYFFNTKRM